MNLGHHKAVPWISIHGPSLIGRTVLRLINWTSPRMLIIFRGDFSTSFRFLLLRKRLVLLFNIGAARQLSIKISESLGILIFKLFISIDSLLIWTRNNHELGIFPKRERAVQAHAFLRIHWVRRAALDFRLKTIKSQSDRWPPKELTERDRLTGIWPWHQWLIPKIL